jgi:hypothetical protein
MTPGILLFMLAPFQQGSSVFEDLFLRLIKDGFEVPEHTEQFFSFLCDLVRPFDIREQPIVANGLTPVPRALGKAETGRLLKRALKPSSDHPLPNRHFEGKSRFWSIMGRGCQSGLKSFSWMESQARDIKMSTPLRHRARASRWAPEASGR